MGSVSGPSISTSVAKDLGDQALLDKIDRLRELNVGALVSLPQLVVVGDQSSGKSSVLESLTGFSFPRAAGLCTRYATQITCRREWQRSVTVSIIPHSGADDAAKERLREFSRSMENAVDEAGLVEIFDEANRVMGIRPVGGAPDADLVAFSENILKIEIDGPDQPALTVIDVPGIFLNTTPGVTTDSDIDLVKSMVKSYMKNPRTMILAVIPCNVDIATQEILKLAKDADPSGSRTMGVLTKPDLVLERAMQKNILDVIQGKRQDLKLGYYVVKNRGADDEDSTLQKRNEEEAAFFRKDPWSAIVSSGRVGIEALKVRLRDLLVNISKKEFPILKAEAAKRLEDCRKKIGDMGMARSDEKSQRAYLGNIATRFQRIMNLSLNAYYTEDPVFDDRMEMRLITRIRELNDVFAEVFAQRGHTRHFSSAEKKSSEKKKKSAGHMISKVLNFEIPEVLPELADIIVTERFKCPVPSSESIMGRIEEDFGQSRGPELGTFSCYILSIIFKEQSKRWEDIALSHVSDAIVLVHQFILDLLDHVVSDDQVRNKLYENELLDKLQASYRQGMDHARFLLDIEREGKPTTYHPYFDTELRKAQKARFEKSLDEMEAYTSNVLEAIKAGGPSLIKANTTQIHELLHDTLKSYYEVASRRFVDVLCQHVVDHFLLNSKTGPLHVFNTELVFDLEAGALEMIAEEDQVTKLERERLAREIESLQEAMKVLRS